MSRVHSPQAAHIHRAAGPAVLDLIERLEKAEAGSRELDALIWARFHPERVKVIGVAESYGDTRGLTQVEFTLPPKRTRCVTSDRGPFVHAEPYTTSLDVALALAERVLPGWCFSMATITPPWVQAYPPGSVEDCLDAAAASTLPLALCIAVLRATTPAEADAVGTEPKAECAQ